MITYCQVRPEHLNHYGYLFGGQLLKWVDEYAWLAAAKEFPHEILVTRAIDKIEFKNRVPVGSILRFDINMSHKGNTSVNYNVNIYAEGPESDHEALVFSTAVIFVAVDKDGNKKPLISH